MALTTFLRVLPALLPSLTNYIGPFDSFVIVHKDIDDSIFQHIAEIQGQSNLFGGNRIAEKARELAICLSWCEVNNRKSTWLIPQGKVRITLAELRLDSNIYTYEIDHSSGRIYFSELYGLKGVSKFKNDLGYWPINASERKFNCSDSKGYVSYKKNLKQGVVARRARVSISIPYGEKT